MLLAHTKVCSHIRNAKKYLCKKTDNFPTCDYILQYCEQYSITLTAAFVFRYVISTD